MPLYPLPLDLCKSPKPAHLEEALELVDSAAITIRLQSLKIDRLTRRGIDPWDWMTDVFHRLPTATRFSVAKLPSATGKESAG